MMAVFVEWNEARAERAWSRPALVAHLALNGFVAMRATSPGIDCAGVGHADNRDMHVMLYRPESRASAAPRSRNHCWAEMPWDELSNSELRRAYAIAVRRGWIE